MTEFEDRDEESGELEGDSARALFARTVGESPPHLAFTADDLVLGGRRRVRHRRLAAVLGSTASAAVVAVAATAFVGGGGAGAEAVSPGTTVTTVTSTSPTRPLTDDEHKLADEKLAAAVFAEVFGKMDPGHDHLARTSVPLKDISGVCMQKTKLQVSYDMYVNWTADGKDPFPRLSTDTSPYVSVSIEIFAPGQADQFSAGEGWGPITRTQLPDGSTLESASAAGGHRLQSVRIMSNRQQIVLSVMDASTLPSGKHEPATLPTNPFPFTGAQLNEIVSGLSLPLPFADGYQPHTDCGT